MEINRETVVATGKAPSVAPAPAELSRVITAAALVFAGYYFGAKIGFALTFQPHPISVLWPPNSILLAALLLTPRRTWWILLLAALPAHWLVQVQSNVPPRMILCWFLSNCVEALIGAASVRAFLPRPIRFDRMGNVAIFCFFGVLVSPFLSSFLDAAFVKLNQWGDSGYWELWRIRFTSNVLAALTIAPLIISAGTLDFSRWKKISPARWIEGAALLLTLFAICLILFNKLTAGADPAFLYLPMPCLLWAAVRFKARGATAAIAVVTFLAIWGGAHGRGPFSDNSAEENALSVQLFLIFMSLPLLFLAALIEERDSGVKALREREERISLAAESANVALWTIDFDRGESWISENGRALYVLGPGEPLSRELFLSRVHPEDRIKVSETMERARNSTLSYEAEYRLLLPDGETRWHIARGRYLRNERGQISELIGIAFDVTAQTRADLDLRLQREEMARLSRVALMGELTASLAHELNQPLTAIASNAAAGKRFIARGSSEIDVPMFEELLGDVFADARRAGQIIHSIHRLVRKGEEHRRPVDLNEVILEVLRLLHSDLLGRSTTVKTDLAPGLAPVSADPVLLHQVLLNLIVNSLEAMQHTSVPQRRILIATAADDGFVQVSVRDHGIGLPKEDPDKIFSHFFSTKPDGMGMGLTIVRSIVEGHGGELRAENVEGGARFCFRLPMTPEITKMQSPQ
ncbi:MAG TPA: MASE1 domain-containing protein [Chthoniobacterales bacterium]|nr:MASE1 domain-containing protein [Chthoniobacterales bacterium]